MATRPNTWFDESKLLPGERIVRQATVRLRIETPPWWWSGTLFLTTDRLFFLPLVQHPLEGATAFWLADIARHTSSGHNRFVVAATAGAATFEIDGPAVSPIGLAGRRARPWIEAIAELKPMARPAKAFDHRSHRAAG